MSDDWWKWLLYTWRNRRTLMQRYQHQEPYQPNCSWCNPRGYRYFNRTVWNDEHREQLLNDPPRDVHVSHPLSTGGGER